MIRSGVIFPGVLLVGVGTLLALGNWYYEYAWITFAFPLGVGILLCVLCAIEMAAALRRQRATVPAADDDGSEPMSWPAAAWMFGLAIFLYAFGFVAGPAAYLLVCLRANGFPWVTSIIVALASILVTWGLFINILAILLPVYPLWMAP